MILETIGTILHSRPPELNSSCTTAISHLLINKWVVANQHLGGKESVQECAFSDSFSAFFIPHADT